MDPMTLFALGAAGMTVLVLVRGMVSMVQGGGDGTRLMFQRTAWQGIAVTLLLLGLLTEA